MEYLQTLWWIIMAANLSRAGSQHSRDGFYSPENPTSSITIIVFSRSFPAIPVESTMRSLLEWLSRGSPPVVINFTATLQGVVIILDGLNKREVGMQLEMECLIVAWDWDKKKKKKEKKKRDEIKNKKRRWEFCSDQVKTPPISISPVSSLYYCQSCPSSMVVYLCEGVKKNRIPPRKFWICV